jgi:hypothetical protein
MLELSDVNEFARASYGPLVVAAATLLVASSFLRLRTLMNQTIDWLVGLFSGTGSERVESSSPQLLRLIVITFLFFAWLPVFTQLSNLAPFNVIYDPTDAMFHNRSEWYPAIGCYFLDSETSARLISQFVWNNVEILQEERAKYYLENIGNSLSPWFFAQSMVTVLALSATIALARPEFRKFRLKNFLVSISIVAYLLFSGYQNLENAVTDRYFALLDAHYSGIPIERRGETDCSKDLMTRLTPSRGDVPRVARLMLRLPEFSSFVPQ